MATKSWTSKADWDGGTLDDLYCPIDLAQLEIGYDILTGKATYIFNAGKQVNWSAFGYTKEDEPTIWRDDFRADSRARYTPLSGGADYDAANHRLNVTDGFGGYRLPATVSVKNVKILCDVYFYGYYDSAGPHIFLPGRYAPSNYYISMFVGGANITKIYKVVGGTPTSLITGVWKIAQGVWRTAHFELNGTSLKMYTDEGTLQTTDGSLTSAGEIEFQITQGYGYLDNILAEHYTLPSPANNTVSFRFAISNNNVDWNPWLTDIGDCGNSRYIKVEVTLSRDDLDSAMAVLKDMTLTYETRKQQPIFI